nr:alpha/beta-hydrolase family protein [Diaphorobacter aerolatus]
MALTASALIFWSLGNGVLARAALHLFDGVYSELDARIEEDRAAPTDSLKSGGPGSFLTWQTLSRQGRRMIADGPDREQIEALTDQLAREPLRVYVGLASAETPMERAQLALAELQRIGAFDRGHLVIATPTGTGWVDEESQDALEYVLAGDVATVAVQYSYFASWLALLSNSDYGVETSRAVFRLIYEHWHSLPKTRRPRLYLHGLSLGALNSDLSHDLQQVIDDPFDGALWSGPPFNMPTWRNAVAARDAGTTAWLPVVRGGAVVRFTAQTDHLEMPPARWGRTGWSFSNMRATR